MSKRIRWIVPALLCVLSVGGTAVAEEHAVSEERGALVRPSSDEISAVGGTVVSIPERPRHAAQAYDSELPQALTREEKLYQDFLSRGTYSRVRSIGGYSGGGGGYSVTSGGGRAIRTSSPSRSSRGGFATINNGGGSLGGDGFATID